MQLFQLFSVAFTALRLNLLRSFLTMLGVIIGVAAVIIMVALGAGAQQEIDRQLDSLGGNIFIVSNSRRNASGAAKKAGSVQRLDLDDAAYLQAQVPGIDRVAPILRSEGQVIYGNVNWRTRVDGIDSGAFIARNLQLDEGRVFSAQELRSATKVVILGETVRAELFGEGRALGQVVRINNFNAKVIGTLLPKGQSQYGDDLDDVMFMPLEAVRKRIQGVSKSQPKSVSWLVVKMLDGYDMTFAEDDIKEALRVNMKVPADQTDTFRVRNMSQILTAGAETEQVFNRLLASVASVSLLVGGIGIMNIMLVSVTERTREIGLRMALGATPVDILRQFLIEAITLCGLGGAMGISIAMLATTMIETYLGNAAVIELRIVVISVLFSASIGIFFGYYPARRASKLQPIDALRRE
ncbi:MAG TPA: multidrug ABC transporter substrate-binding protein [Porticoccaceae bacterium]|nr:multidrug ABC transporter substrate-binding protein [Porticoccaceae bacterium]